MTQKEYTFNLMLDTDMILYTKEIRELCPTFSCGQGENEQGLNDFFENDADLYREELLGKTYNYDKQKKTLPDISHDHGHDAAISADGGSRVGGLCRVQLRQQHSHIQVWRKT